MTTIVSYTPEQTATAVADYKAGATVEAIAATLGKSVKSVIAKLAREKIYVAKASATGAKSVTKADLISAIAVKFMVDPSALDSLAKADKATLLILAGVDSTSPVEG